MILCNGQRYFNVALDSSRSEFVVRSVIHRPGTPIKLYFSNPLDGRDSVSCYYYDYNNMSLGGQFYSNTELKYLYNSAFHSIISRPKTNSDGPFVLRDPTSGNYVTNGNAYITTGTEAGREYALIRPGYTNVTSEQVMPALTRTYAYTYGTAGGYDPYIGVPDDSPLKSAAYKMDIYMSAWFSCQVQNVFSIPANGGIYTEVTGIFPNSSVPSGQVLHTCSSSVICKYLLGNLDEGFLIICVSGGNTVKLLPDDMTNAQGSTYWTQIRNMSVPALKVFLNYGGNVRLCQWGYELACGPISMT